MDYRLVTLTFIIIVTGTALYLGLKPNKVNEGLPQVSPTIPNIEDTTPAEISFESYMPQKPELVLPKIMSAYSTEGTPSHPPLPTFPLKAKKSGHCIYELQVDGLGTVESILSLDCSDEVFARSAKSNLLKWRFHLQKDGYERNIPFRYGPKKMVFKLLDEDNIVIPE